MPTPFLDNKAPYEKLYGHPYDITILRVFGFLCFPSTHFANRKKLDLRATTSVFQGFKSHTKVYVIFYLKTRVISVSRNVIFYEDCFHFNVQDSHDLITILPIPISSFHDDIKFPASTSSILPFFPPDSSLVASIPTEIPQTLRRSERQIQRPCKYKDFHVSYLPSIVASHSIGSLYPLSSVLSYSRLSPSYHSAILSATQQVEP